MHISPRYALSHNNISLEIMPVLIHLHDLVVLPETNIILRVEYAYTSLVSATDQINPHASAPPL